MVGNHVSHSNRKTKRRFQPNLHTKKFFVPELNKWITVKVSAQALRTINKLGIFQFLKRQHKAGFNPRIWVKDANQEASAESKQRGYRRVEHVDANGHKTYSVTYEPQSTEPRKRVSLASLLKGH